jgi:hypothetical protein
MDVRSETWGGGAGVWRVYCGTCVGLRWTSRSTTARRPMRTHEVDRQPSCAAPSVTGLPLSTLATALLARLCVLCICVYAHRHLPSEALQSQHLPTIQIHSQHTLEQHSGLPERGALYVRTCLVE